MKQGKIDLGTNLRSLFVLHSVGYLLQFLVVDDNFEAVPALDCAGAFGLGHMNLNHSLVKSNNEFLIGGLATHHFK